jgi:hypothetical protein
MAEFMLSHIDVPVSRVLEILMEHLLQSVESLLEVTSLNRFDSFEPLLLEFATLEQSFSCCLPNIWDFLWSNS